MIPERKILGNIKHLKEEGLIDNETEKKAGEEIKKEKPYISCLDPDCDGLLREIEKDSVEGRIKDKEDG